MDSYFQNNISRVNKSASVSADKSFASVQLHYQSKLCDIYQPSFVALLFDRIKHTPHTMISKGQTHIKLHRDQSADTTPAQKDMIIKRYDVY